MENEFDEVMSQRTNEELVAILNSPEGDYQPAAIEAAQRLFKARKLPEEKIKAINDDLRKEKELAGIKANEPLETYYKVVAFFIPIAILPLDFVGYDRKANEYFSARFYGRLFYCGLSILVILLRFVFKLNI